MPATDELREALDLNNLPKFPGLKVLRVDAQDYTDWEGLPALRVDVLLDESVDIDKVAGATTGDFKSAIRDNLRKHGINLFAYIFLAKPSEFVETDED